MKPVELVAKMLGFHDWNELSAKIQSESQPPIAKQAAIIQAQADADASRTYATSFGKDPEFYEFYRAMKSYEFTFVGTGQERVAPTTVVLSPQNDYLKEFTGRSH